MVEGLVHRPKSCGAQGCLKKGYLIMVCMGIARVLEGMPRRTLAKAFRQALVIFWRWWSPLHWTLPSFHCFCSKTSCNAWDGVL